MKIQITLLLSIISISQSFWCPGHMLVSQIAQDQLTPALKDQVNTISNKLKTDLTPDFVQSACWMDDIKKELGWGNYHFLNTPYNKTNPPYPTINKCCHQADTSCNNGDTCCKSNCNNSSTCGYTEAGCKGHYGQLHGCAQINNKCVVHKDLFIQNDNNVNIVNGINLVRKGLSPNADFPLPIANQTDPKYDYVKNNVQSFSLRALTHFMGDIHQPLHVIDMQDEHHPNGDEGGNGVYIKLSDDAKVAGCDTAEVTNLHKVWDSVMLHNCGSYPRTALTAIGKVALENNAKSIVAKYPRSSLKLSDKNPNDWAQEGFKLASEVYDYKTVGTGKYPNDALIDKNYIEKNYPILEERIAYGGYRLADEITNQLSKKNLRNTI